MADAIPPNSSQTLAIAASALHAQQTRMRIIAENIANADSTSQTSGGDPYRRQIPVFTPTQVTKGATGVKMNGVAPDTPAPTNNSLKSASSTTSPSPAPISASSSRARWPTPRAM